MNMFKISVIPHFSTYSDEKIIFCIVIDKNARRSTPFYRVLSGDMNLTANFWKFMMFKTSCRAWKHHL
ncbi:hypothetical protein HanIR_Chr16g0824981 [Helianthus annuus]|nr:hypothetical protein HanIR_Chr16g0824981 [Helianthus annuus]